MASKWYMECAPCGLAWPHETQDQAIDAAEQHRATSHQGVKDAHCAAHRIATVRNRDENEFAAPDESAQPPEAGQES